MSQEKTREDEEIAAYWQKASTAGGRLSIRASLLIKRCLWQSVVGGSFFLKRLLDVLLAAGGIVALSPCLLYTSPSPRD